MKSIWISALMLAGCGGLNTEQPAPPAPLTDEITMRSGRLESGVMAIGGETTGWQLHTDGGAVQVDISHVEAQAARFDGEQVTLHGAMTTRDYPESGPTPIFVAEKIEPVQP